MRAPLGALVPLLPLALWAAGCSGSMASPPAPSTGGAASASTVPPQAIKVAYSALGSEPLPLWLGDELGIYQKYGLAPESLFLQSSAQVAPAMVAGEIALALSAGSGVIEMNLAGGDLVFLASTVNYMPFVVHARADIQRLEDLEARRLAITRLGSGTHLAARLLLQPIGLVAGREVTLIQAGTTESMVNSLLAGAADAAVLGSRNVVLERQGFPPLVDVYTYRIPSLHGVIAARRSYIAENPAVVRSFLQGFVESLGVIQREREVAKRILSRGSNEDDDEVLEATWQRFVDRLDEAPFPSLAGVQTVLDSLADPPAAQGLQAENFVDERPIRELEASGFIRAHLRP